MFLASCFFSSVLSQINETTIDPAKKYEDLIKSQDAPKIQEPVVTPHAQSAAEEKQDELILLLPKLDPALYTDWNTPDKPVIWTEGNPALDFSQGNQELFNELKLEKILKQTYTKENHIVDVLIYKFKDFTGAYSAYTVLHSGATTKLKVGKNASESDKLVNFWRGNYFIDIHTNAENDSVAKEFIILASQDISKNLQTEQMPPVVAIQLPALNRVQGTEKYCLGSVCCKKYFTGNTIDFDLFNLSESGGIITAQYQEDNSKDKERISLILSRYITKESAQAVFASFKEYFEKQKLANKEMEIDFDIDDSTLKIKNQKNNYTMLKQRGNLLAIAYNIMNKKSGKQVLALIPWPIEIAKPINTITDTEK
ncbi:MAG: hypothetical protein A3I68_02485 [Candidatus Melainabacteria bacterium RIFCSPLOWO2_02_FULL_35_15]|nr:MAG: hypothetical protein A3F80_00375 [Candidatus Melainabacteria bacterium RIFCSPLOWO2_12_FULL_35_11]OGI13274.1 MAG: hypothetical protein A3I68_02485 [Candidatus Melainabacteria bacterium RIFCSPLOWO2_02_FULL_35_15]